MESVDPTVFRLAIFVLAIFVGYYVVWSVTPALHTPLMAVTNAISSVIIVGALLAAAAHGAEGAGLTGSVMISKGAGALAAAIGGVVLSGVLWWLNNEGLLVMPFMNRVGLVFLIALALAGAVSLLRPAPASALKVQLDGISFRTSAAFNLAGVGVIAFLILVYAIWW